MPQHHHLTPISRDAPRQLAVQSPSSGLAWRLIEVTFIVLVFFLYAGSAPPGVNEAHYLAKARHYWNPSWCADDFFLESRDAHQVFFWTLGGLAAVLTLPVAAWLGRWITWLLLAGAWQRLSWSVCPQRWMSVLTAALFVTLLDGGHLAGEWVVGGVEAKGIAYALLWLAMAAAVQQRWWQQWLLLGLAASFHVLVGGWGLIAVAIAWCLAGRDRPALRSQIIPALVALVLALPGLVFGLMLNAGCDPATVREAERIYVFERLSHHLVFHLFPAERLVRHLALLVVWWLLWRRLSKDPKLAPVGRFVCAAVGIAAAGIGIDVLTRSHPEWAAAVLRLYWFRLSDAVVPVGVALGLGLSWLEVQRRCPRGAPWWLAALLLVAASGLLPQVANRWRDPRPPAESQSRPLDAADFDTLMGWHSNWLEVCRWIKNYTAPQAVFLTPRGQQTFKWYASRAEVVSWKDIPQDAAGIVQWWQRLQDVSAVDFWGPKGAAAPERELHALARQYGAQFVLVDRSVVPRPLHLPRVYPEFATENATFEVYDLQSGREP